MKRFKVILDPCNLTSIDEELTDLSLISIVYRKTRKSRSSVFSVTHVTEASNIRINMMSIFHSM